MTTCTKCGNAGPGYDPVIELGPHTEPLCSPCAAGELYAQADYLDLVGQHTEAAKLFERADDLVLGILTGEEGF